MSRQSNFEFDGRTVVVITPYVPFKGIGHAGGLLELIHIRALVELGFQVTVLAPNTSENCLARQLSRQKESFRVVLYGRRNRKNGIWPSLFNILSFAVSRSVRSVLQSADVIEFQWEESLALLRSARIAGCRAPATCFVHDVSTQRLSRRAHNSPLTDLSQIKVSIVRFFEARYLTQCRQVFVLSEKDRRLLASSGSVDTVFISRPPLYIGSNTSLFGDTARDATPRDLVLVVAAWSRRENAEGLEWFLRAVWPLVLAEVPLARLSVVGGGAPASLAMDISRSRSVEFVGYAEDLDEYYTAAKVCVVPLFSGAGVKFKTVEALIRRVPVVGTSVGFEGIELPGLCEWQADSAEMFAKLVVKGLRAKDQELPQEAFDRARIEYSYSSHLELFRTCYSELLDVS